jgi:hypothetical protein
MCHTEHRAIYICVENCMFTAENKHICINIISNRRPLKKFQYALCENILRCYLPRPDMASSSCCCATMWRSKQYIKALHSKLHASWCRMGNKSVNMALGPLGQASLAHLYVIAVYVIHIRR